MADRETFTITEKTAEWVRLVAGTTQIGTRFTEDERRLHVRSAVPDDPDTIDDHAGQDPA